MDKSVLSFPIDFYYAGQMQCKPGHQHGPAVRDHFLIHYIHRGSGEYELDGICYKLGPGSGFLICPGIRFRYKADRDESWAYKWVAFRGEQTGQVLQQLGLNRLQPLFYYDRDDRLEQILLQILAAAKEESRSPHDMLLQIRMRKACELMLQKELNIGDIARSVGYEDPMRFSKVFKQVHRASPSQYRTRVRP